MDTREIIELVSLCITTLGLIISLVTAIVKGHLKDFIVEKMEEVEKTDKNAAEKLSYVINAVKDKYKIVAIIINIEAFVEKIIDISKQINYRKK